MANKKEYDISGMHCASCALVIEKKLQKLSGIKNVNVNFAVEKATIEYDDDNNIDDNKIMAYLVGEIMNLNKNF
ncbi:MAG: heavy metal-associated domain-containing protein [Patescibacteria group bacterium]